MEIEQGYRIAQHANLGYPLQQYQYNGRNTMLAVPNIARPNPRVCPVRGPINGLRTHLRGDQNDGGEISQARKRVAVACARCRKRKIRCSGDPGDGTGCQNCISAGVDSTLCQFHRVGSGDAGSMLDLHHNLNQIANSHPMMQIYNTPTSPLRSRPLTYPLGLDTKSLYHQQWTAPYSSPYNSEDTSPVEAYGLEQASAYMSSQNPIACSSNYRWSTDNKLAQNNYTGHEPAVYGAQGMPYMQHNVRSAASSEALSHSMTSLQLTLPERPHTRSGLPVSQRPQLPIPLPSPAQGSRNVVDQLQDQRLRSAQAIGASGTSLGNGGFVKPALPFSSDADVQVTTATEALAAQIATCSSASTADSVACYSAITPTTGEDLSVSTGSQYNFSTSPLFDATPTPTQVTQPTYSNFRGDYKPSTPSPTSTAMMARQVSQTNLYSIGKSSSCKDPSGRSGSTLVSGHQYTPLSHSQSQPQHGLTKKTSSRPLNMHRATTATLNRGY